MEDKTLEERFKPILDTYIEGFGDIDKPLLHRELRAKRDTEAIYAFIKEEIIRHLDMVDYELEMLAKGYRKDFSVPRLWIADYDDEMDIGQLTREETKERCIGALTGLTDMREKIESIKESL